MENAQLTMDQVAYERKEHLLLAYYDRLKQIDEVNRDLTNFFYIINVGILAVVFELVTGDWQRLILAFVGYSASVALMLIGYKYFWAWQTYETEMLKLEAELQYWIAKKYAEQLALQKTAGAIGVTKVRLRFNAIFVVLWFLVIVYFALTTPAPWHVEPPAFRTLIGVILTAAILAVPWIYLAGTARPARIWAVGRVL